MKKQQPDATLFETGTEHGDGELLRAFCAARILNRLSPLDRHRGSLATPLKRARAEHKKTANSPQNLRTIRVSRHAVA